MINEMLSLTQKHERWRGQECVNLIPSENVTSAAVRSLLSSDFGHRYTSREGFYMGTHFIDETEQYGEKPPGKFSIPKQPICDRFQVTNSWEVGEGKHHRGLWGQNRIMRSYQKEKWKGHVKNRWTNGKVIVNGEESEKVRKDIVRLAEDFQEIRYCFR